MENIKFAWEKHAPQVLLIIIGAILLMVYALFLDGHPNLTWLDPVIGFATFIVALMIWFNGLRREYLESLQKRITVYFQYQGRNVFVCEHAILFNESDARAWSFQIGQQMSGSQKLKIDPFFKLEYQGVTELPKTKQKIRLFVITQFLTELPIPDKFDVKHAKDDAMKQILEIQAEEALEKLQKGYYECYPQPNSDGSFTVVTDYFIGNKQKINL